MTTDLQTAAAAAAQARADVAAFDLPQGLGGAPFADAYSFQDAYVAAIGAPVAGYKLAVNGAPQQAMFGVDQPVSGRIFAAEIYRSGVALPEAGFGDLCIEPEIAAVLGDGVAGIDAPVDRAGALAAIDRFHPAIELIDQRGVALPQVQLAQAVALNVFNAGIVLGEGHVAPADLDLPAMRVALDLDGARAAEVTGNAPQDPVEAVAWLLTHLAARGLRAEPGMVVMCGTHLPLRALEPGTGQVDVTMSGLGAVSFSLTD